MAYRAIESAQSYYIILIGRLVGVVRRLPALACLCDTRCLIPWNLVFSKLPRIFGQ